MARECPDLDLYHPWALDVEAAIALARRCEQAAFAADKRVSNSEGASVSTQQAHFVSANSHGFMGGYPTSRHYISASLIAGSATRCSATTGTAHTAMPVACRRRKKSAVLQRRGRWRG